MVTIKVSDNIYLFSSYLENINLTFNQFLLCGDSNILIHTGNFEMATVILPKIKELLGERQLDYVFISHFESDECGGISLLLEQYPQLKAICSAVTQAQLRGFGINCEFIVKKPGEYLEAGQYDFKFISYLSEMHLWEGLMAFETSLGMLFSCDIFIRFGKLQQSVVQADLDEEINGIRFEQVPSEKALEQLKEEIQSLPLKVIMPGHGPCLKL